MSAWRNQHRHIILTQTVRKQSIGHNVKASLKQIELVVNVYRRIHHRKLKECGPLESVRNTKEINR